MVSRENLTWTDVEAMEGEGGRTLFADKLNRRRPNGSLSDEKILIRVPSGIDKVSARAEAREWFTSLKLDPDRDKSYVEQLEQMCLLAKAVRHPDLQSQYLFRDDMAALDEMVLQDLQSKVLKYEALSDPRVSGLTEDELWKTILKVAKGANLGPLLDIAGPDQPSLVVRMAQEACHSATGKRWQQSFEISIREPSARKS